MIDYIKRPVNSYISGPQISKNAGHNVIEVG